MAATSIATIPLQAPVKVHQDRVVVAVEQVWFQPVARAATELAVAVAAAGTTLRLAAGATVGSEGEVEAHLEAMTSTWPPRAAEGSAAEAART
jgi:hypothetical protein